LSPARSRWRDWLSQYGILLAFLALVGALALLSPNFLATSNLLNVLRQIAVNALLAFGMTTVILGAGIDLSVGSVLAFSGALAAGLSVAGWHPALAMVAALLAGVAMGLFNGVFVAYARIAPFIATLGGLTIFRGATLVYTDGRPITGLPDAFDLLGNGVRLGVPVPGAGAHRHGERAAGPAGRRRRVRPQRRDGARRPASRQGRQAAHQDRGLRRHRRRGQGGQRL
jgi:ribose/xylose/arabinose/galactoside ABC-type transport system permease subunit